MNRVDESEPFRAAALSLGYAEAVARLALQRLLAQLQQAGIATERAHYLFRGGPPRDHVDAAASASPPPSKPRTLLIFATPDSALAFAQQVGLGRSPRLVGLHPARVLAIAAQRPSIEALLFCAESEQFVANRMPLGRRVSRNEIVALLDQAAQDIAADPTTSEPFV